jgi:hypothetical protein
MQRVSRHPFDVTNRYLLDGDSKLHVQWEKRESLPNAADDEKANSSVPRAIREFVLPAGFPGECSYTIQLCKLENAVNLGVC